MTAIDEPELPLGSKLDPHPLDAYVSAEPDEPTFTLQGGDVLASPLVTLWVRLARARCGLRFEPEATLTWLQDILAKNQVENEGDRDDLLRRATEAEHVIWAMQDYRKGIQHVESKESEPSKPVEDRLDLFDYTVRTAQQISNAFSELNDSANKLEELGHSEPATIEAIREEIIRLRKLYNVVEPRPGMKLKNV